MALPRNVSLGVLEYVQIHGVGMGVDDGGGGGKIDSNVY